MLHLFLFLISLNALVYADSGKFVHVPLDLSAFNEDKYLGPKKEARLVALGDKDHPFDPSKLPLILVHGIRGNPSDLQAIIQRMKNTHYQIYILAYADFKRRTSLNGADLYAELKKLNREKFTIVAHSMGGLVARKALSDMICHADIENKQIRLFTIDTPWHGFHGPPDSVRFSLARPFIPNGLEDMRARSNFFKELNRVSFPSSIMVDIAFAEHGEETLDYTDFQLDPYQRRNLESALKMTGKYKMAKTQGMEKYFPRFPGNHTSVITENGLPNYLDYLELRLEE